MNIKSITFENYKAFSNEQCIKLRPITILIGKNSSGKSSIAKLFTLIENSFSGNIEEPLLMKNSGVEIGAQFVDLIHNKETSTPLNIIVEFEDNISISISILQEKYLLRIIKWSFQRGNELFTLTYLPENDQYKDMQGEVYRCEFKGFVLTRIINNKDENLIDRFCFNWGIDVDYIGPFRKLPERSFYLSGKMNYKKTGIRGENAYSVLCVSKRNGDGLCEKVGEWYKNNFDGWKLDVKSSTPYYEIELSKDTIRYITDGKTYVENTSVNLVDVGQGMSQALPLVVRANMKKENSIIVMEQPELHLHPAAHANLAELFAKSAKNYNQSFILETHSENILLRLRKLVIENDFGFTAEDLVIYWIDEDEIKGQCLKEIIVDKNGELSDWPEDVFRENLNEVIEIRKILRKKNQDL